MIEEDNLTEADSNTGSIGEKLQERQQYRAEAFETVREQRIAEGRRWEDLEGLLYKAKGKCYICWAVREERGKLKHPVEKCLRKMMERGQIAEKMMRWFGGVLFDDKETTMAGYSGYNVCGFPQALYYI